MTDRDRLVEEARHEFEALANMSYTGWRPDITGDGVRRIRELLCDLVHALQDCERERDDYKHAAGAEAQLADLNMERAKEAEQRVKEQERLLLEDRILLDRWSEGLREINAGINDFSPHDVAEIKRGVLRLLAASPPSEEPRG